MTGADESNSTSACKRELIALPKWLPPSVEKQVQQIDGGDLPAEHHAVLLRLVTDGRMRWVWSELSKKSREANGGFAYPAKSRHEAHSRKQDEVKNEALGELFRFAFCAACDRIAVSKAKDAEHEREKLLQKARMLRELAGDVPVYVSTHQLTVADDVSLQLIVADTRALLRVATYLEHVAAATRKPSDPMIVQYHRGDPVLRGVQIEIAVQMLELFGKVLHGITAT